MGVFRTQETREKRKHYRLQQEETSECEYCFSSEVSAFTYWKITEPLFPLDGIAEIHHLFAPKRHVPYHELTPEELQEFLTLKQTPGFQNTYDIYMESTNREKDPLPHFRLHLVKFHSFVLYGD
jgi:hypothetical protein